MYLKLGGNKLVTLSELADPNNVYFWIITLTITLAILFILKSKIQMLMTITSFAYPNAKFNAVGNDYVRKAELEALIEARSFQDAAGILGTHNYPVKESRHADEAEAVLDEHNVKSLEEIMQDIPKGLHPLVKSYMKKYEVGVIKRILKFQLSKTRTPGRRTKASDLDRSCGPREQKVTGVRPVGDLTSELIQQLQDSERADEIADLFAKTPFGKELREAIHEYDGNFQRIENILDKYVFNELRKVDGKVSSTMAVPTKVFVDHLLDISNIKLLLRAKRKGYPTETCKEMLYPSGMVLSAWKLEQMCEASNVPELVAELEGTKYYPVIKDLISDYEKSREVSPLEIALDKYLLRLVVEIAIQYTTTAGPTIRYMVSREYENRNLKTILHGLDEGLGYKRIMPLVITQEEE
jgi:vacuolar-type H+-ATPase subunit C/Vma6